LYINRIFPGKIQRVAFLDGAITEGAAECGVFGDQQHERRFAGAG
jgi:hypothetical protein